MIFKCIKDIIIKDVSTWEKSNVFVTLDHDWANDDVLNFSINLIEKYDVSATWFITHDTYLLYRLRNNFKFELGIHPNFNTCLFGEKNVSANNILDFIQSIVPEAVSLRSHSLTKNSILSQNILKRGIKYESNVFINTQEFYIKPYELPAGLIQANFNFGDYSWLMNKKFSTDKYLSSTGLKILNFHPIHLYLNTIDIQHYESAKPYFKKNKELEKFINTKKFGVRNLFEQILSTAKEIE